jgi:hypothetical protein
VAEIVAEKMLKPIFIGSHPQVSLKGGRFQRFLWIIADDNLRVPGTGIEPVQLLLATGF